MDQEKKKKRNSREVKKKEKEEKKKVRFFLQKLRSNKMRREARVRISCGQRLSARDLCNEVSSQEKKKEKERKKEKRRKGKKKNQDVMGMGDL